MEASALVNQGEDDEALAAIDKLIEDFGSDPGLAEAVYWIGKEYEWKRGTVEDRTTRYGTPDSVYERLVQEFGDTQFGLDAGWDKKRLEHRTRIFTLMKDAEPNEVAAAIAAMEADFAGRAELASELYWVGREYEEYPDKYPLAKQKYERIISEYPDSVEASQAGLDIARLEILSLITAGDINNAEAAIDEFVEDFNSNPHAGPCLRRIAKEYYMTAMEGVAEEPNDYYRRAIGVWNRVIERAEPTLEDTGAAYYFIGVSYRWLGEYARAAEYFQTMVDDWPDFEYGWSAQYYVGLCYEEMVGTGRISESEAQPVIEQAYERVLEGYPRCPTAGYAAYRLALMCIEAGDIEGAKGYYELLLEMVGPGDKQVRRIEAELEKIDAML